jgi:hypothetical protein
MTYKPTPNDRNTVKVMAAAGIPQDDIAKAIGPKGIDPKTLRKQFRRELDTAMTEVRARIGQALAAKAMEGDVPAIRWYEISRLGYSEKREVKHDVADGLSQLLEHVKQHGKRL